MELGPLSLGSPVWLWMSLACCQCARVAGVGYTGLRRGSMGMGAQGAEALTLVYTDCMLGGVRTPCVYARWQMPLKVCSLLNMAFHVLPYVPYRVTPQFVPCGLTHNCEPDPGTSLHSVPYTKRTQVLDCCAILQLQQHQAHTVAHAGHSLELFGRAPCVPRNTSKIPFLLRHFCGQNHHTKICVYWATRLCRVPNTVTREQAKQYGAAQPRRPVPHVLAHGHGWSNAFPAML